MNNNFNIKYLKYKNKYIQLKNQFGAGDKYSSDLKIEENNKQGKSASDEKSQENVSVEKSQENASVEKSQENVSVEQHRDLTEAEIIEREKQKLKQKVRDAEEVLRQAKQELQELEKVSVTSKIESSSNSNSNYRPTYGQIESYGRDNYGSSYGRDNYRSSYGRDTYTPSYGRNSYMPSDNFTYGDKTYYKCKKCNNIIDNTKLASFYDRCPKCGSNNLEMMPKSVSSAYDIGMFSTHLSCTGLEYLTDNNRNNNNTPYDDIITKVGGNKNASFIYIPHVSGLEKKHLDNIKKYIDDSYQIAILNNTNNDDIRDFKINLTNEELNDLISEDVVNELVRLFNGKYHEIKVRRCESHGNHINFHVDFSKKTLQLALNGDDEYNGGKLVFINNGILETPERPAGSATIHEGDIVHGVTEFKSGVRYGLFFLQHEDENGNKGNAHNTFNKM